MTDQEKFLRNRQEFLAKAIYFEKDAEVKDNLRFELKRASHALYNHIVPPVRVKAIRNCQGTWNTYSLFYYE